jgi:hypothetical protein
MQLIPWLCGLVVWLLEACSSSLKPFFRLGGGTIGKFQAGEEAFRLSCSHWIGEGAGRLSVKYFKRFQLSLPHHSTLIVAMVSELKPECLRTLLYVFRGSMTVLINVAMGKQKALK